MSEKKAKFTAIDAIIILVILAVIVVGAIKILPSFTSGSEKEKVDFTVMVQNKDEDFANAITIGDDVTISLTEKDGGVVKNVESKPAVTMVYNSIDGTYSNEVIEGKYDVYVTIEADTDVSDLAIKAGGTAVKVGAEIPVRGKGYASTGYVESVRQYTVDALEKKGKVTDKKSEKDLGEIVDVQVENATLQSTTASGELKNPELPGRYTCYVTIRATGKESDDNYILEDSTELSVGRNVDLYSKYVKTSGDIKSVKVVE